MLNYIYEPICDDIQVLLITVRELTKGTRFEKKVEGQRFYYYEWRDENGNKFYQLGVESFSPRPSSTQLISLINHHFNLDLMECEIFEKDRGARCICNWAVAKKDIRLPHYLGYIRASMRADRRIKKILMPQ